MKNRECLVDDAFLLIYDVYINNCLKRFLGTSAAFARRHSQIRALATRTKKCTQNQSIRIAKFVGSILLENKN